VRGKICNKCIFWKTAICNTDSFSHRLGRTFILHFGRRSTHRLYVLLCKKNCTLHVKGAVKVRYFCPIDFRLFTLVFILILHLSLSIEHCIYHAKVNIRLKVHRIWIFKFAITSNYPKDDKISSISKDQNCIRQIKMMIIAHQNKNACNEQVERGRLYTWPVPIDCTLYRPILSWPIHFLNCKS
jgi:hypothetical protein